MPRKLLIRTADFPYHIVCRSRNRDWYDLPMKTMWKIALNSFAFAMEKYPVEINAFVLMSNHYHLLVTTPDANIDKFMFEFNRKFSELVRQNSGRINQIFGGRYEWSLVKDHYYLSTVYRYIYRNPVDAGIVAKVEDFPYSSLNRFPFKLHDLLDYEREEQLKFFNEKKGENERGLIRKGMRRKFFDAPVNRVTREKEKLPTLF